VPVVMLRKILGSLKRNEQKAYSSGFDPGSKIVNQSLALASRCEWLPQKISGTSVMAVLESSK
jgi:hypothetical protein